MNDAHRISLKCIESNDQYILCTHNIIIIIIMYNYNSGASWNCRQHIIQVLKASTQHVTSLIRQFIQTNMSWTSNTTIRSSYHSLWYSILAVNGQHMHKNIHNNTILRTTCHTQENNTYSQIFNQCLIYHLTKTNVSTAKCVEILPWLL